MVTIYYSVENWIADIFENGVSFHEEGTFLYIQDEHCFTLACVNKNLVKKVVIMRTEEELRRLTARPSTGSEFRDLGSSRLTATDIVGRQDQWRGIGSNTVWYPNTPREDPHGPGEER